MAPNLIVNVLEHCKVSPSPDSLAELSLPLSFFDMSWLNFHMFQGLLFYEFPHPKIHMVETIIPNLKASLSLTLKHYLPLAGNLLYPSNSATGKPSLRYVDGDSVHVTFAESSLDFDYLKGNQARNVDDLCPLLPQLPPITDEPDCKVIPLVAMQVTLFPGFGIAIGSSGYHVLCDGNAIIGFMKAWSSIHKLGRDANGFLAGETLATLDRTVIKDKEGLAEIYWNQMKDKIQLDKLSQTNQAFNSNKVLATFVFKRTDIGKLKNLVLQKGLPAVHVSSFTITCAYFWSCLVKSGVAIEENVDDNQVQYFIASIDCRARLKPPIPANYFGNCIAPCIIKAKHAQLAANEGFLNAAITIGEAIAKKLHYEEGFLKDAKSWISDIETMKKACVFGVTGSPKFEAHEIDFGWGKPEKGEIFSIVTDGTMSLNQARTSEGGAEVGLALPKNKMDAFATIFSNGLMNMKF